MKFRDCIRSINEGVKVKKEEEEQRKEAGTGILVPLTSSLYVKGQMADREKVLVDVGTGFFVEKVCLGSTIYCDALWGTGWGAVGWVDRELTGSSFYCRLRARQLTFTTARSKVLIPTCGNWNRSFRARVHS